LRIGPIAPPFIYLLCLYCGLSLESAAWPSTQFSVLYRLLLDPLVWPTYDAGYLHKPATNAVAGCFGYLKDFIDKIVIKPKK